MVLFLYYFNIICQIYSFWLFKRFYFPYLLNWFKIRTNGNYKFIYLSKLHSLLSKGHTWRVLSHLPCFLKIINVVRFFNCDMIKNNRPIWWGAFIYTTHSLKQKKKIFFTNAMKMKCMIAISPCYCALFGCSCTLICLTFNTFFYFLNLFFTNPKFIKTHSYKYP